MNFLKKITFLSFIALSLFGCNDDEGSMVDTEKPTIDLTIANAFPTSCDTLYFDEPFTVTALLRDNVALGSFNIDIHHNFDQHTHTTEIEVCDLNEIKMAVNPFVLIEDYEIPANSTSYTTAIEMNIPSTDDSQLYDEGDYHLDITVLDQEGWSSRKGLNVKILRR